MTPRTPSQFREIREEKKSLLMDVALRLFASDGYHNTTISKIARQAGISKGLIYNYFDSKEELLSEIISKSFDEIARYFDPDHDGHLSEAEFELFIRKLFLIILEKLPFWRLVYQLLMQKEVRGQLLKSGVSPVNTAQKTYSGSGLRFMDDLNKLILDYFIRKKEKNSDTFDPILEMKMFIYTIEGFALITIYMDEVDKVYYDKTINRIIEMYK
jgi:AcrR family transcriptional regulator